MERHKPNARSRFQTPADQISNWALDINMSIDVREEVNGTCSSTINVRLPARHRAHSRFQPMLPLSTAWVESRVERSETRADQISNWAPDINMSIDVREKVNGTCSSTIHVLLPARHRAHSRFQPMLPLSTARVESRVESSETPADQISGPKQQSEN
ncbi:hypothetical protein B0H11DRAFT_1928701 [Mycena galericulata]|nr:hypothetical protein B0H11DRAFT_1928701 [Mycena galericulata]